jgi:hypothetical protein
MKGKWIDLNNSRLREQPCKPRLISRRKAAVLLRRFADRVNKARDVCFLRRCSPVFGERKLHRGARI